ncbi:MULTISPECIES: hypothetical protein [Bacillus]|nr:MULTISPECIES: hypothetical protein [Bacillus cereus group]EEL31051.1 hypothetical protein bcere0019_58020 [Bacillus cereus Rock3-28]MCU5488847.1 hypothetical protein [Bacillus cereus]
MEYRMNEIAKTTLMNKKEQKEIILGLSLTILASMLISLQFDF